ncbi:TPA: hypothetical protein ACGW3G_000916 [Stenotrophomonas maltophilia]
MIAKIPFAFCRSAIFAPTQIDRSSETVVGFETPTLNYLNAPLSVVYSGPEIGPAHHFAWQVLTAMAAKGSDTYAPVQTRLVDVARAMGRTCVDTNTKRWVLGLIEDLAKTQVAVKSSRQDWKGPLLSSVSHVRGAITVSFPPNLVELLSNEVVLLDLTAKKGLLAHPLAAWLYDFTSTLSEVFRVDEGRLHHATFSVLPLPLFRLRIADAFKRVAAAKGIASVSVANGVYTITRANRGRKIVLSGERLANAQRRTTFRSAAQQANTFRSGISGNL